MRLFGPKAHILKTYSNLISLLFKSVRLNTSINVLRCLFFIYIFSAFSFVFDIILFGAKDGDTLSISNLKSPIDLAINQKFNDVKIGLVSFEIWYFENKGKVKTFKFSKTSGNMMNTLIADIKRCKPSRVNVVNVHGSVVNSETGEIRESLLGSSVIYLK